MKHILMTSVAIAFSLLTTAMAAEHNRTASMVEDRLEYERTLQSPTKEFYDAIPMATEMGQEETQPLMQREYSVVVEEHAEPRRRRAPHAPEACSTEQRRRKAPPVPFNTPELAPKRAGTIANHPTVEMPRIDLPLRQESVVIPTAVVMPTVPTLEDYIQGRVAAYTGKKPRDLPEAKSGSFSPVGMLGDSSPTGSPKEEESGWYDGE